MHQSRLDRLYYYSITVVVVSTQRDWKRGSSSSPSRRKMSAGIVERDNAVITAAFYRHLNLERHMYVMA